MNTTPQEKPHIKYVHWDEPFPREKAEEKRLEELDYLKRRITNIRREYADLLNAPLQTTVRKSKFLRPGDDGYDEAPDIFVVENYQGEINWLNITEKE